MREKNMKLWLNNSLEDRLAMLQIAETEHPGIRQSAIEKDWWVTITLKALFQCSCVQSLIFKGGTSLSKGFDLIKRFSEDIDLSIDHSFFGIEKTSKSQREKLRKLSRSYIHSTLSSELDNNLRKMGVSGHRIENVTHVMDSNGVLSPIDSDKDPTVILVHYTSIISQSTSYISPYIKIEISSLSMDEPTEERDIRSIIAESFSNEDFTSAKIRMVVPTRTFLEKIFLLSEEFQKERPRSFRMSRHLYDIEKLMDTNYGRDALADKKLYEAIIEHRRKYYALKFVNYELHSPQTISFLPPIELMDDWNEDYIKMQQDFIYGDSLSFSQLISKLNILQDRLRNL
ncbi:hypothetical protein IX332_001738 [Porphyromonas levii]|nr:hypothetical protein [Porphyromonas levii]MBR8715681.1 hypothetical protein [Porphyromonas levii]MBR8728180.1 hypothetical protein [Porphyromonas levii]MBR8730394.1 hypothetical protein [Porphyromonas levii]MBR8736528.1 hypothetical protein [Porphyromonas levii]